MKWITVVILVIATISLVFGSFIMLFGSFGEQAQTDTSTVTETTTQE